MLDNRLEIIVEVPNIPPTDPTSDVYGITRYYLDTYSSDQDPMELNFVVNDIKDLSNRNASSSKTIVLPETPNNREVFGFVSDLNTNTLLFSPNKRTKCYVLVDSVEVFQGWLQLRNVKPNYRTGFNKLEAIIYSNQLDFFKAVGESYLQDLTGFKNQTFTHSLLTMTSSWFQDQTQLDYYYPLIDYGFKYDITQKEIATGFTGSANKISGVSYSYVKVSADEQMFPAIYLKSVVDTIFSSASGSNYYYNGITQSTTYQYDSYFFNSPFFRSLIIPYSNGLFTQKSKNLFNGNFDTHGMPANWMFLPNPTNYINLTNYTIRGAFDVYTAPAYIYTGQSTFINIDLSFSGLGQTVLPDGLELYFKLWLFYGQGESNAILLGTKYFNLLTPYNTPVSITYSVNTSAYINSGNYIVFDFYTPNTGIQINFDSNAGYFFNVNISSSQNTNVPIQLGEQITLPGILPANVKQKDFLNTLFNMFNLYIDYDPNVPNILRIEPRDDYYYFNGPTVSNSPFYMKMNNYGETYQGNIVIKDWSEKVDINEDVNIEILANTQNKTINLTYKEDKDYYNDNYKGYINRVYGNKLIEVDNDFNTGQQNIEVLFGPTVLANVYDSFNFPVANLTKQIDTSSNVPSGRSNCNMKLMQRYWDYISPTSSYVFTNKPLPLIFQNDKLILTVYSPTMSSSGQKAFTSYYTFSYYPYAGNFNNPYFPSADLNFDQAFYYYYNIGGNTSGLSFSYEPGLNNTIYNTFYQNQMNEILDNTSRIVTCKMYLSPKDIQQFRFSDLIYLRLGSSGQYYHVNKISNYSLTTPQKTVDVELIKVLESANYPLP